MSLDPEERQGEGPVIRDKRRIDPETGQVRERPDAAAPGTPATAGTGQGAPAAEPSQLEAQLAERTADLQRLQAEYLNYKRRVDRERENARKSGLASMVSALLPALDDIGRAREHDELTGGFRAVADSIEGALAKAGVTAFGEVGDEFDPRIHEALMHSYSDEVDSAVCVAVLQVGYQLEDRIIRPARVAVAEPSSPVVPDDTVLVEDDEQIPDADEAPEQPAE